MVEETVGPRILRLGKILQLSEVTSAAAEYVELIKLKAF